MTEQLQPDPTRIIVKLRQAVEVLQFELMCRDDIIEQLRHQVAHHAQNNGKVEISQVADDPVQGEVPGK